VSAISVETREGKVELPDARTLAYADRGPADGAPLIFHHGTPGSRLGRHPDGRVYDELGVRVVSYDRAGYGLSDRLEGRDVSAVAADISALADELGLDRFGLMGVSGGGPHALATAALLGERVTRAAVLVTPAPNDEALNFFEGMTQSNVDEFNAALAGPDALAAYLAPYVETLQTEPEAVLDELGAELPAPDQAAIARPEIRELLVASWREATRQGAAGWMDDDLAFTRPWGFELADVDTEVRIWQGELDVLAPKAHGRYVAGQLQRATYELVPGKGHMLYDVWADAFAWAAD
jgi:pimeloyl-ACP methyl ester carboxylesterase